MTASGNAASTVTNSICATCADVRCNCPIVSGTGSKYPKHCDACIETSSWCTTCYRGMKVSVAAGSWYTPGQLAATTGWTGTFIISNSSTAQVPAAKGWECPRCRAINAPYASQCTCAPNFAPPSTPPAIPWPDYNPYSPIIPG